MTRTIGRWRLARLRPPRHVPVVDQRAAADPRLAARQETAISATAAPLHRPPEPPGVVGAPVQRA